MLFNCPTCGVQLQVADDRAGRRGKCRSCGAQITAPGPIAASDIGEYNHVWDLMVRQSEMVGEMLAYGFLDPWLESCRRFRELDDAVGEEEDPERIRDLIDEIIDMLARGPAERDVRSGRRAVLDGLLTYNDQLVDTYSARFPRARRALDRLRSSPSDETFVGDAIPEVSAAIAPALDRLEQAHRVCKADWQRSKASDSWTDWAREFVKGAALGATAGVTLGWFGVVLATAQSLLGDARGDSGEEGDSPFSPLFEASDGVGQCLVESLPSVVRASRYVLRTFFERVMRTVAGSDLSSDEWRAWAEAEAEDLEEVQGEYAEFADDDAR